MKEDRNAFNEISFELILESCPNAIVLINSKGTIVFVSGETERLFEYTKQELVGEFVEVLIPERYAQHHPKFRELFFSAPSVRKMGGGRELFAKRKDGSEFPVEIGLNPVVTPKETLVLASIIDITERKQNEEKLALTEKQIVHTLDAMLEGAQIIDFDWKYVYVNAALEKQGKYPKEELYGYTMMEKYPGYEDTPVYKVLKKTMDERVSQFMENEFTFPDGTTGWFELSIQPVEQGIFILSMDITERKLAEKELEKLNNELEEKVIERTEQLENVNKELEAFSYSVSHDLRAPLRAISGYAQMLSEDFETVLDDEGKRLLNNIRYNATKMGTLIDNLLEFSRLGRKEIQRARFNMEELVQAVEYELSKSVKHNAVIKINTLPKIKADYQLISQVVYNLLANAVKYSSKKEKPIIEISAEVNSKETIFSIKDNGAGFNMKYANKLFGVFQRLHSNEEFEGTGVGLATVQRIISKHDGRIWAESEVDKGATFYFSIPT